MKKTYSIRCTLFLFVLLVLFSCQANYGIPERKMKKILVEMHLADGVMTAIDTPTPMQFSDSTYYYGLVLKKYGYTYGQFRHSLSLYMKNPLVFERVYDEVIDELKKQQERYPLPPVAFDAIQPDAALAGKASADSDSLHYEIAVSGDTLRVLWY